MASREVIEGLQPQGPTEAIAYRLDVTPPAVSVESVIVTDSGSNVTSTVMPTGTASVSGGVITLPVLKDLSLGHEYEVVPLYVDAASNKIAPVLRVLCQ